MPSIVQNVEILEVAVDGVINNGDSYVIAPASDLRTYSGSGNNTNGDLILEFNGISKTVVDDADIYDIRSTKAGTKV